MQWIQRSGILTCTTDTLYYPQNARKDDTHCEIARYTIEGEAESMTNVTFAILKRILIAILHSRQSPQTN